MQFVMDPAYALTLLAVFLFFFVPLLAIGVADNLETMSRGRYLGKSLGIIIFAIPLVFLSIFVGAISGNLVGSFIRILGLAGLGFVQTCWTVYRVQDIGWPRSWVLIYVIPIVNLGFFIVLLFVPGELDRE